MSTPDKSDQSPSEDEEEATTDSSPRSNRLLPNYYEDRKPYDTTGKITVVLGENVN